MLETYAPNWYAAALIPVVSWESGDRGGHSQPAPRGFVELADGDREYGRCCVGRLVEESELALAGTRGVDGGLERTLGAHGRGYREIVPWPIAIAHLYLEGLAYVHSG